MVRQRTPDALGGRMERRDATANRARILEVATTAVKRDGIRVPMTTIAADAGVGIGTVYRHFATREHLMIGLTERSFQFARDNARAAGSRTSSARDAVGAFFELTIRDRDEFVLPWNGGPTVRSRRIADLQAEVWRLVGDLVARGREDGSIRPGVTAADVIMFAASLAQPLPNTADWDRIARRQARIYLSGMGDTDAGPLSGRPLPVGRGRTRDASRDASAVGAGR